MSGESESAMVRRVVVEVPATSANLGAGFDSLGLALDITNEIHLEVLSEPKVIVTIAGEGADTLPHDESHLALRAARRMYEAAGASPPPGLHLHQVNRVPLAGGLGSSATAIVGGLLAAAALAGLDWDHEKLLRLACEIEGHPDNVAPALLGGLVTAIRRGEGDVCAVSVPVSAAWRPAAVLAVPDCHLETRIARSVLAETVPLEDAVFNVGRSALFVASATAGRLDVLDEAMQDRLHQRQRGKLVPGMCEAVQAARRAGAYGACISGSGPTVLALVADAKASAVAAAMREAFAAAGLTARVLHTAPRFEGARVRVATGSVSW